MKRTPFSSSLACLPVLVLGAALFAVGSSSCTLRDLTIGKDRDASASDTAITMPGVDASRGDTPVTPPPIGEDAGVDVPDAGAGTDSSSPPLPRDAAGESSPVDSSGPGEPPTVVDAGLIEAAVACPNTAPGVDNCGPSCESCSTSPLVPGGTFYRSYDGVQFTDNGNPATISSFRLDRYEVTVGRFRKFVDAIVAGWRPTVGSGKHSYLNGGRGLVDVGFVDSFEPGWLSPVWNNNLFTTATGWNTALACPGPVSGSNPSGTWTASAGANENQPINCLNWYQSYAFCIWDGGFLPSEAEWNFAASGGNEQRFYPWSNPPDAQTIDCSYANYTPGTTPGRGTPCSASGPLSVGGATHLAGPNKVGTESPKGDARWGQADLAGNVQEWTLDWHVNYAVPCTDCSYLGTALEPVSTRETRGAAFISVALPTSATLLGLGDYSINPLPVSQRGFSAPSLNISLFGVRCARAP